MADPSDGYQLKEKSKGKRQGGKKLLSNNFAQLMVFFNGLVLTLTAYFTLSVFVSDIVKESMERLPTEAQNYISDRFSNLQQSLYATGVLISVADGGMGKNYADVIITSPVKVHDFSQLMLIAKDQDKWASHELFKKSHVGVDTGTQKFAEHIATRVPSGYDQAYLVVDFKGITEYESDLGNMQRPVALVRPLPSGGDKVGGYLVGIVEIENLLMDWLDNQSGLVGLNVQYQDNFVSFPLYQYRTGDEKGNISVYSSNQFQVLFGSTPVFVSVEAAMTERESFIKNIPFLLLVFGSSLTLIGTLYVRNNQRQSSRLSVMNRTLAQKNFDLSVEVKERERLNKALKKAERENRAILDSVNDIIFETEAEGNILFLNHAWKDVTGMQPEECIGNPLFYYLHPQDQEEQKENFSLMIKGKKQAYRSFVRLSSREGSYRAVELGVSMIRHDENKNMRVVGTVTDVEERRRAEQALSEAERKYRTIIENIAGGIYQLSEEGVYLSANPAMAKILGYASPSDLLASVKDVNRKIYKDSRKRMRFLRDVEDFGDTQSIEIEVCKQDGSVIWVTESARAVYDDDGQLIFYEGSMSDITERKEVEMKLREAKVQSDLASRAKSEFLTNMSHELRTPLNAIIGFSEIIKNQAFGPVGGQEYLDYAQDIHDGGKKLLNVINEILDVSRIETGDRTLNEGVVDLKPLAQTCIDLMGPKIEANELIVMNSIPDSFPALIGEELAVKQMVMNLLSNAVKFTPVGGRVTISAEINSSGGIRLSITDTGVGLDEEEIEKVLSPFGQIENQHSKSSSGTGLGLTLVDALVKLHEGNLELFSQKGIGTTATLIFPPRRVSKRENIAGAQGDAMRHHAHYVHPSPKSEN